MANHLQLLRLSTGWTTSFLRHNARISKKSNLLAPLHTRSQLLSSDKTVGEEASQTQLKPLKDREDRIDKFYDPAVQSHLQQLTGCDVGKVFRNKKVGQKLREPKFTFMTEDQLEESYKEAEKKAESLLQMPPVLPARKEKERILSFDPHIQGFDVRHNSTIILTDITLNVHDRDRIVVAREPDGTLRHASWEERTKMNKVYFPTAGREFRTPKMFTDVSVLKDVLARASSDDNTYTFVLDRACQQFEPDDPTYISVVEYTYTAVDNKGHFDLLYSTRHYGPFIFFLVRTRRMDNLLMHYIKTERISHDATTLVSLFHVLFPESASRSKEISTGQKTEDADINKIKSYIEFDAIKRNELELALNSHLEIKNNKKSLEEGLKRAHGMLAA